MRKRLCALHLFYNEPAKSSQPAEVFVCYGMGVSPMHTAEAAVARSLEELTVPLIGSTLTPIVVFVPLIAIVLSMLVMPILYYYLSHETA